MPVFPKRTACIAASALLSVSAFAADCVNGVNPTGNCTVPTGVTSITIEAWGGGGGGSGSFFGGGGGGGSYCKATFAVAPGAQLTVTVGMGGAGGGHGISGTPGTPSSVMGTGVAGMQANAGSGGRRRAVRVVRVAIPMPARLPTRRSGPVAMGRMAGPSKVAVAVALPPRLVLEATGRVPLAVRVKERAAMAARAAITGRPARCQVVVVVAAVLTWAVAAQRAG